MSETGALSQADVLFVTKPLAPPWDDSGKLLPYLIATNLERYKVAVLTTETQASSLESASVVPVAFYGVSHSYTLPLVSKLRLMDLLARASLPPLVHLFFTPTRTTATAFRLLRGLRRGSRFAQTLMSLPLDSRLLPTLVSCENVFVWSRFARQQMERKGLGRRVFHCPPGIVPLEPFTQAQRATTRESFGVSPWSPMVLYAGDLEYSDAAGTVADAAQEVLAQTDAVIVFACRPKTPRGLRVREELARMLHKFVERGSAKFFGTLADFRQLLAAADVQVLPAGTTYAKTDIPLVLLEGLSAGVVPIVGLGTPMEELVDAGVAIGVTPGDAAGLATSVLTLIRNRSARRAMAELGRKYVMSRHTARVMAQAYERAYQSILGY